MPNSRDSLKRDRQGKAARSVNRSARSAVRTAIKKVEANIVNADKSAATENIRSMIKVLDTAARKGLIKKNTAARKKSRLQKKVNSL